MDIRFVPVALSEIRDAVRAHLEALPRPIDSFLEDHILESKHYRIALGGADAGFASIHKGGLITQYRLDETAQRYGQPVFQRLRKMESVNAAFVPTCDEFFLSHALDDYRLLARQAYFFTNGGAGPAPGEMTGFTLRLAVADDVPLIRREVVDFLEDVEKQVLEGEVYVTHRGSEFVGIGVMARSRLYGGAASIGMYTAERHRGAGVGTATIALLMDECRREGLRPVAGCWYYNHASKRTLERAGLVTRTRLLRIEY